nr:30S ribosomal protein S3 [Candidatus Woesearchaeota archaeon]
MIERKFIAQNIKEKLVQNFVAAQLERSGHSKIEIKRTALGEKIIIYTNRPGLIVGRKGENIKRLTLILKKKFDMENPEIEVAEINQPYLDPNSVADNIITTFERFGPKRFKYIGYDTLSKIMKAGAIGAEILISGRGVPGARAKRWRFSAGYLKKSGNVSETGVLKSLAVANLRTGSVGVQIKIMPPNVKLPDRIILKEIDKEIRVELPKEEIEQKIEEKPEEKKVEGKKRKVKGEDGNTKKKRTKAA